jgi:hypothetical protein
MDRDRFDHLTRSLATLLTRRRLAGVFGLGALALPSLIGAKKRHKQKRKKRIKRNAFGCVNVGKFCKRNGQCCSGRCKGKKSKKKCKAHDAGAGCVVGDQIEACGGTTKICTTSHGKIGSCATTTGKVGYCFNTVLLGSTCGKDAECQAALGSTTAACLRCPPSEPFCADGILF